jgi:hypothetical protein
MARQAHRYKEMALRPYLEEAETVFQAWKACLGID